MTTFEKIPFIHNSLTHFHPDLAPTQIVTGRSGKTLVPLTRPTFRLRANVFFYHGSRILLKKWPGYTFDDLAACQDALDGPAFQTIAKRMWADPQGRQLMVDRPQLNAETMDFEWFSKLPQRSLGHQFFRHLADNQLLEDVKNFQLGPPMVTWDSATEYAKLRYRQTHDLRHVLLGLGVEGYEEVLVQTFQYAQQPQVLSGGIVFGGGIKHGLIDRRLADLLRLGPKAWQSGKQARFLSLVRFENLWEVPIEEVRRQLRLLPVGTKYLAG